ncbi:MAG: uroporphyrinogen-III C-methyltransferase [Gammaproteobacteria bacterium]|nr:uroporphyrinogen-III C-methyltransferase [Gammaproteobacteria bacterium]
MEYLPVFLRLESRKVLVVGGGAVALRKVRWLLKAKALPVIVAPALHRQLARCAARGEVRHVGPTFTPAHLEEAVAVIAATADPQVNREVSRAAGARNLPVNVVDDGELSSFIFPAIIERSPLLVAVGTAANAPVLARLVRAQIEALLPARLGVLARFMGARRAAIARSLAAFARRAFWERIVTGPVAAAVLRGDEAGAEQAFSRELRSARLTAPRAAGSSALGEVYLIGAGPGDPDLLTLRGLQLLQQADVILYDRLVGPAVLERARRDAERIFVGKEPGECGQQHRINELLVRLAREGKRVARLKGGDPFVFGRGGEELEALCAHDIPCTVVPGITAALGAAAATALPLTHRRFARSVTFVSGHDPDGVPGEWQFFADPRHTVVFYMGLAQLSGIIARLRAAGAMPSHPAALIERATLAQQRIVRGSLADIGERALALAIQPPALLITGEVAAFSPGEALNPLAAPALAAEAQ